MELNSVEELIDDIRQGKMVILMDDEDRENEGDIILAAEQVRPEDINFMAKHARGLICLTLTRERCEQLDLPLMVTENHGQHGTNFTVSIEAAEGVTTGISAADRARTVRAAVAKDAVPRDIVQPGHIFPLMAQPGGVLNRAGHTEAGCDLARLAGFEPASVIVEVMNEDGTMARRPDLELFAQEHGLKIGTISDLIHYRSVKEKTVECISERRVATQYGDCQLRTYRDVARDEMHFAFIRGEINADVPTPVRVHVMDIARDVMTIQREEDKRFIPWTFHDAMSYIGKQELGVVVLICHPETAQSIEQSIDWMLSGKRARPTQEMVYRQVGTGAQILKDIGVGKIIAMAAPLRFTGMAGFDIEIVDRLDCPE